MEAFLAHVGKLVLLCIAVAVILGVVKAAAREGAREASKRDDN